MLHFLNKPFFRPVVLLCCGNISGAAELLHMAAGHAFHNCLLPREIEVVHEGQEAALGPRAQGNLGTAATHRCTSTLH